MCLTVMEVLLFGFLCFCAVGASAGLITGLIIGMIALLLCVLGAVFCAVKHKGTIKQQQFKKWKPLERNGSKNTNLSWQTKWYTGYMVDSEKLYILYVT